MTYSTSDQHQQSSETRMDVDLADYNKIYSFLEEREPFRNHPELVNIVTGVEAGDHVTSHKALSLGNCILNLMVGQDIKKFKFPRKMTVVNMAAVLIKGKKTSYTIDPNFLFQRLLSSIILRREEVDVGKVFSHELCTFPPRLFSAEDLLLAAESKSQFTKSFPSEIESCDMGDMKYVIDGGMLLHRIPWRVGASFNDICASHVQWLSKYPGCSVVFDGYQHSSKDMVHKVRTKNLGCSNITPELSSCLTVRKTQFLSNTENKQRLIHLLSECLEKSGFSCCHAPADADVMICRTAVTLLKSKCNVTVVGDDTDLLVILIHMTKDMTLSRWNMFMSTKTHVYDVLKVRSHLGDRGTSSILLLHSFTGCDTVSRIFGIGQGRLLSIRHKLSDMLVETFYNSGSRKDDIKNAGEKIFFLLLNLPSTDANLDAARLRLFNSKVIKGCAAIESTSLPPTSAAALQHSLRVYHQIQTWLEKDLDATEWGWKIKDGNYVPVTSKLPVAPENILKIIYCNCKTGCKKNQCSCLKNGILCGPGCLSCIDNCENRADTDD